MFSPCPILLRLLTALSFTKQSLAMPVTFVSLHLECCYALIIVTYMEVHIIGNPGRKTAYSAGQKDTKNGILHSTTREF
jgi:hypothetical protein